MPDPFARYGTSGKLFIYFATVVMALVGTVVTVRLGAEKGILVGGGLLALVVVYATVINFRFGFYAATTISFFIFFVGRFLGDSVPVGSLIDILIFANFFGLIFRKVMDREPFFKDTRHLITSLYLLYTLFIVAELFNPSMHSMEGWLLVFRKYIQFLMVYFIALHIFTTPEATYKYFRYWAILSLIAGGYGCIQEWFGFLPFEEDWIKAVPGREKLYILVGGVSRRFSTFSDPAAFGIIMGATFPMVLVFFIYGKNWASRIAYFFILLFVILGVAYSGTRTAYLIIIAAILVFVLMTITNKRTLVFACLFVLGFMALLFGPFYGNPTINRIRSSFEFSEDASLQVRDINRAFIQPYIYRHPIGGGLATSGLQGKEFNPNHYLAGFPPDSGFVKTAVETGWVGLFLQCLIYFFILQSGAHAYFRSRNENNKHIILAMMVCAFAFIIGQYGQVAIGQFPGVFLFYGCLGAIAKAGYWENKIENIST